jgi:hypothetical protein
MSSDTKHIDMLSAIKHVETVSEGATPEPHVAQQTLEKTNATDDDIAFRIFTNIHDVADEIDPHAERKLLRKIDFYIIPFICVTYLITIIDKAALGYGTAHLFTF